MDGWKIMRTTVAAAIVLLLTACGNGEGEGGGAEEQPGGSQAAVTSTYADITVEQLQEIMAQRDPFLVNVHIPFEGDLPETDGSIQFDEIAQHLDELPADKNAEIILYCRSGRMSSEAAGVLANLGFTNVSNLAGGFRAWEAAGLELVRAPAP